MYISHLANYRLYSLIAIQMPPKAKAVGKGRGPAKRKLAEEFPPGEILPDTGKKSWKLGAPIGQGGFGLLYLGKQNYVYSIQRKDRNEQSNNFFFSLYLFFSSLHSKYFNLLFSLQLMKIHPNPLEQMLHMSSKWWVICIILLTDRVSEFPFCSSWSD